MNPGKRRRHQEIHGIALAAPRWWPTWIGAGLLWCCAQLPLPVQRGIGRAIGGTLYSGTSDIQRNIIANLLGL